MIFLVLNCFLAVFFLFFTNAMDKSLKNGAIAGSDLSVSLLLTTIESIVFSFTLVMHKVWFDSLSLQLLKIVFSLDAIFFTMLSFGLIGIAKPIKSKLVKLIKYGLYVFKHTNFIEIICHLPKNIFLTLRSEIEVCSFYSTTQSVYLFSARV